MKSSRILCASNRARVAEKFQAPWTGRICLWFVVAWTSHISAWPLDVEVMKESCCLASSTGSPSFELVLGIFYTPLASKFTAWDHFMRFNMIIYLLLFSFYRNPFFFIIIRLRASQTSTTIVLRMFFSFSTSTHISLARSLSSCLFFPRFARFVVVVVMPIGVIEKAVKHVWIHNRLCSMCSHRAFVACQTVFMFPLMKSFGGKCVETARVEGGKRARWRMN